MLAVLIISGPISLTNLEGFLDGQHRLPNLRTLVICTDQIEGIPGLDQLRIRNVSSNFGFGIPFPTLRSLSIRGPVPSSAPNSQDSIPHRIFDFLLLSRFQHLREFVLIVWDHPTEERHYERKCLLRLFKFLSRRSTTLRTVGVILTENSVRKTWNRSPLHIRDPVQTRNDEAFDSLLHDLQVS